MNNDCCYSCGDWIDESGYCPACYHTGRKSDKERDALKEVEVINETFDRPIRIVVKPIRREGAEWKWSISVNIGGWKQGETANVLSDTIVGGIAYGLRMLNGEIEE